MYTIIDGTELNDKRLRQALELDRSVYPENYLLDEAVVFGYWREHPEIYICACDGDDLVAYLNVSCIDERSYRKLCSGTENDLCIRAENIRVPDANGVNYMYLSSVVVRRDRRKIGIAEKLLRVFADRLEDLRDRGIYIFGYDSRRDKRTRKADLPIFGNDGGYIDFVRRQIVPLPDESRGTE